MSTLQETLTKSMDVVLDDQLILDEDERVSVADELANAAALECAEWLGRQARRTREVAMALPLDSPRHHRRLAQAEELERVASIIRAESVTP